jgi:hypothetical protein
MAERRKKLRRRGILIYCTLPFIQWFGFYRMYKVKDFKPLLISNYLVEVWVQSLPCILISAATNAETRFMPLSSLQSFQLAINALNLIECAMEGLMIYVETRSLKAMRDRQEVPTKYFVECSEEDKRDSYYQKNRGFTFVALIAFIIALVFVKKSVPERECPPTYGFDESQTVCLPCSRSHCIECGSIYSSCSQCERGFHPDERARCIPCDSRGICQECDRYGSCTMCLAGYRVRLGTCDICEAAGEGCLTCADDNKCSACATGYYMDQFDRQCRRCDS